MSEPLQSKIPESPITAFNIVPDEKEIEENNKRSRDIKDLKKEVSALNKKFELMIKDHKNEIQRHKNEVFVYKRKDAFVLLAEICRFVGKQIALRVKPDEIHAAAYVTEKDSRFEVVGFTENKKISVDCTKNVATLTEEVQEKCKISLPKTLSNIQTVLNNRDTMYHTVAFSEWAEHSGFLSAMSLIGRKQFGRELWIICFDVLFPTKNSLYDIIPDVFPTLD